tara:strand:- start:3597 stop:3851 length:255 start_codon:yes stop_codon:yes gene_type:complete
MRIPKINSLVECTWNDILGQINSPLDECKPTRCTTIGHLAIVNDDYLVIVTSEYEGEKDDQRIVDATAIPLGVVEKVVRIKVAH